LTDFLTENGGRKNSGRNFIFTSPSQILTIMLTEKLVKEILIEFLMGKIDKNKIVTDFLTTIFSKNFVF